MATVPNAVWGRLGTLLRPFEETQAVGQPIDTSVELRLGAQEVALEMFLDNPFIGVGAGNYPPLYQVYSQHLGVTAVASEFYPHNLYLQVLAETGAIGIVASARRIRTAARPGANPARQAVQHAARAASEWRELAFGTEVALGCYLLSSTMLHASYPRYLWMLLALAVAARRLPIVARQVP